MRIRYDEGVERITISVPGHSYDALIEAGLLEHAGRVLRGYFPPSTKFFVITAPPIWRRWGKALEESLVAAELHFTVLNMADGERFKTMATVSKLAQQMVAHGADRKSAVLAFGGGVVGDVAGFCASIYMRGIEVVQIPTTLLAQVDAAIGGKTGVDLPAGKNLLGTFHQPRAVLIDPRVLSTLPARQFRSGLFEVLKYGFIRNPKILEFAGHDRERILERGPEALHWLITASVRIKAEVVAADEREGDLRRILNFGHTIGHALEADTKYRHFLHGEAVAWGMIAAARIAAAVQRCESTLADDIEAAIRAFGPLPRLTSRGKAIARLLQTDKKTLDGAVHFVLPRQIGQVEVVSDVPAAAVIDVVEDLRKMSQARAK